MIEMREETHPAWATGWIIMPSTKLGTWGQVGEGRMMSLGWDMFYLQHPSELQVEKSNGLHNWQCQLGGGRLVLQLEMGVSSTSEC